MRQIFHRAGAVQHRRREDADRAGIRVSVRVAADLPVHRTDVEAGAATQAIERLAQRTRELAKAPVVEQDQMELVRSVELTGPSRPLDQRRVHRELLSRRAPRQQRQEHRQVGHRRDDLLHAHDRDVDAWQRRRHPAVPLVGHEDDRPGVRDGEVRARDAEVRAQELLA